MVKSKSITTAEARGPKKIGALYSYIVYDDVLLSSLNRARKFINECNFIALQVNTFTRKLSLKYIFLKIWSRMLLFIVNKYHNNLNSNQFQSLSFVLIK